MLIMFVASLTFLIPSSEVLPPEVLALINCPLGEIIGSGESPLWLNVNSESVGPIKSLDRILGVRFPNESLLESTIDTYRFCSASLANSLSNRSHLSSSWYFYICCFDILSCISMICAPRRSSRAWSLSRSSDNLVSSSIIRLPASRSYMVRRLVAASSSIFSTSSIARC